MKTKLIKIAVLVLLVATSILLVACANTKEDQAKIISYLDKVWQGNIYHQTGKIPSPLVRDAKPVSGY